MTRYAKTMSQALAEVQMRELKMNDPKLNKIFDKYNVRGTWYAHASVGCLHVRPVLNMKIQDDIKKMRNIANETSALVKKFNGSYSGEHGDGCLLYTSDAADD